MNDSFIMLVYQLAIIFGCIHVGYLLTQCGVQWIKVEYGGGSCVSSCMTNFYCDLMCL